MNGDKFLKQMKEIGCINPSYDITMEDGNMSGHAQGIIPHGSSISTIVPKLNADLKKIFPPICGNVAYHVSGNVLILNVKFNVTKYMKFCTTEQEKADAEIARQLQIYTDAQSARELTQLSHRGGGGVGRRGGGHRGGSGAVGGQSRGGDASGQSRGGAASGQSSDASTILYQEKLAALRVSPL